MTDQSSGICGQCGERWHLSTIGSGFDSPTPVHDKQPVSAHNVETDRFKSEADNSIDIEALARSAFELHDTINRPVANPVPTWDNISDTERTSWMFVAAGFVRNTNQQLIEGKRFECMETSNLEAGGALIRIKRA